MDSLIRVYVNQRAVDLPAGSCARDAVARAEPGLLSARDAGELLLTDGRGLPLPPDAPLQAGAILRAQRSARRAADADA
jgi:hypothetical protein